MSNQDFPAQIAGSGASKTGAMLRHVQDLNTARFFDIRPAGESHLAGQRLGFTGQGVRIAILDSGVLLDHPLIAPRLVENIDCTGGNNPQDEHGHGTVSTLIALATAPSVEIVNIKVFNAEGAGKREWLLAGLEAAKNSGARVVNLSGGVLTKRFFMFDCDGTCDVCLAGLALRKSGATLTAAAGNIAGETLCPGIAGVLTNSFFAVAAFDEHTLAQADYSGSGNIHAPSDHFFRVPL